MPRLIVTRSLRALLLGMMVALIVMLLNVVGNISGGSFPQSGVRAAYGQSLLGDVTAVAAGGAHTCALTTAGNVKCWGSNEFGQLGDGTETNRPAPAYVLHLSSNIQAITAGGAHTCALTTTGGVKCWGNNDFGQLGDGTTFESLTPVNVSGLTTGVQGIAAGEWHTCALTTAGSVKCWGKNGLGQLGDNSIDQRQTPVDVHDLTSGVKALTTGGDHTCALTSEGGVKCWGNNVAGQLGDGTTAERRTPVDVSGLTSGVQATTAGYGHTCALTSAGGVKCWGNNDSGQLGDQSKDPRLTAVDVISLTNDIQAITGGFGHTCALTSAGDVKCWGQNDRGQLGDESLLSRWVPVDVDRLASSAQAITANGRHTCALMSEGGVKCWGHNGFGQLGIIPNDKRQTPVDVMGLASGIQAITAGSSHTCALATSGGVKCWGQNAFGQMGDNTNMTRPSPVDVNGLASGIQSIAAGGIHACGLTTIGGVKCWGYVFESGVVLWQPQEVATLTSGVQAIGAGGDHSCALSTAGGAKCWGYNFFGQLGNGNTDNASTPVNVAGLTSGVRAITAGAAHTCALTAAGGVKCWGFNSKGQLGNGSRDRSLTPANVSGLTSGVQAIAAGNEYTCALTTEGGVKCWGSNAGGQMGDGAEYESLTPVNVSGLGSGVLAIATGGGHICALMATGGVKCLGSNGAGQLGDGTTEERRTPVDVLGLRNGVQSVIAGEYHTCALTSAGGVKCWGANTDGQLGDGTFGWASMVPADVVEGEWLLRTNFTYLPFVGSQ